MNIPGIYKISSKIKPSREYYGSSQDVFGRLKMHLRDLRRGKHHSPKLQYHYNKYGEADLIFQMVLGCEIIDLIKTEQYFLDSYKPYFNILPNAGSHLGAKRSIESCKRCSLAKSGKNHHYFGKHLNEEHKKNLSKSLKGHASYWKGKKLSEETKNKMSEARMHHTTSDETKNKISISNKGKKRSGEFRKQCSERNKFRKVTEETRRKLSIALTGRIVSDETRKKLSKIHKGRKASPEFCEKMSRINIGNKHALGHRASPEARARLKAARAGRIFSKEARMKMSIAGKGRKQTAEQIRKRTESANLTRLKKKIEQICQN